MLSLEDEMWFEKIIIRNKNNHWVQEIERDYPLYQILERRLRKYKREYQKTGGRNDKNTN